MPNVPRSAPKNAQGAMPFKGDQPPAGDVLGAHGENYEALAGHLDQSLEAVHGNVKRPEGQSGAAKPQYPPF